MNETAGLIDWNWKQIKNELTKLNKPEWKKEPKLTKTNCCWSGNKWIRHRMNDQRKNNQERINEVKSFAAQSISIQQMNSEFKCGLN